MTPRASVTPPAPRFARGRWTGLLCLFASVVALAAAMACDKIALTAPSGSAVTLFSNTTVIPLNGSAEITASVIESGGTPVHDGTVVTFTTTIGALDRNEGQTDDGKVKVVLRPGTQSGTAFVRAFSGGAQSEPLELTVGAAAVANIVLTASPATVSAMRGGVVVLTATVVDEGNNAVPNVSVNFTASAGTLGTARVATDANGNATTTLSTNRQTTVRATIGAVQSNEITITANAAPTVTVSASPSMVATNTATTLTATITRDNNVGIRSAEIEFGDGEWQPIGASGGSVAHAYRNPGTYVVTVTVTDVNGEVGTGSTSVVVTPAPPLLVNLAVSPNPTTVNQLTTFTVTLSNSTLTPNITRIEYEFGDGNTSSTGTPTTYIYRRAQEATAKATVFLNDGRSASATLRVIVNP